MSMMSTPSDSPQVGCVPYQRYQSLLMSSPEEDAEVKKQLLLNGRKRQNSDNDKPTARDDSSVLVTLHTPPASAAAVRGPDGRVDTSPTLSPSPATQTLNQLSQQSYGSYLDLRGSYHNNNDTMFGMSQLEYDVAATLVNASVQQMVAPSPSTGCQDGNDDDEETQDPHNETAKPVASTFTASLAPKGLPRSDAASSMKGNTNGKVSDDTEKRPTQSIGRRTNETIYSRGQGQDHTQEQVRSRGVPTAVPTKQFAVSEPCNDDLTKPKQTKGRTDKSKKTDDAPVTKRSRIGARLASSTKKVVTAATDSKQKKRKGKPNDQSEAIQGSSRSNVVRSHPFNARAVRVHQLDPSTGAVLATFPSLRSSI